MSSQPQKVNTVKKRTRQPSTAHHLFVRGSLTKNTIDTPPPERPPPHGGKGFTHKDRLIDPEATLKTKFVSCPAGGPKCRQLGGRNIFFFFSSFSFFLVRKY